METGGHFDCLRCGLGSALEAQAPHCPRCGSASGVIGAREGRFECLRCMHESVIALHPPRCPRCGSGDGILSAGPAGQAPAKQYREAG